MKNLKAHYKLLIYLFLLLNTSSIIFAKNLDKFSKAENISNYFSGILAINDSQYQKSHNFLKSLNDLENSHYRYSQYFQYSLITLRKFKDAANYSKKLEKKKIDNFESNLISGIYYLKNKDFDKAKFYFKKLRNKNLPGSMQNLVANSLNSWSHFADVDNLKSALSLLDTLPKKFQNIQNIQKVFAYCYFDSNKTDEEFKKLTSNPNVNYSRYFFFHTNYLASKKNKQKAKETLKSYLKIYPKNLILNQFKLNLEKEKKFNNQFDCRNSNHVIAEILYIVSNALASQENYVVSNFYLILAKYLNSDFLSYDVLYAENLYKIKRFNAAKKIYHQIKEYGSTFSWYASKQIAYILIEQEKKKEALSYLKNSFQKIKIPTVYEIFDYARFLKNNEKFEESVKYYSEVLSLIETKHELYGQVLDGRGTAYERIDQWDKAEVDLLNSLIVSPENAYVINYLAYSWIEKEINIKKSLKMLRKANTLRPNDGYIIDSLGWALFKLKNYKEAKKHLELAVQYMPSDPVVNDHYADALWRNNKTLQARYYWNYVLRLKETEEELKKKIEKKLLFGLKS